MKKNAFFTLWVFLGAILATAFYISISIIDHRNGNSGLFDLGLFEQILYQISEGGGFYNSILGKNFLADHFSLILFPLAFIYKLFPFTETLLVIQSLALGLSFSFIVFLARAKGLSKGESILWGGFFGLYPSVLYISLWDFHTLTLAIPLLVGGLVLETNGKWKKAWMVYLSVLLIREELGLVLFGVGLTWFFFRKQRWLGFLMSLSGAVFFMVVVFQIMPSLGKGSLSHIERYGHLGKSLVQIGQFVITHPLQVFWESTTARKLLTLGVIFAPFLGLSFIGWRDLIPLIIPFIYTYLSQVQNQFDFRAHYMSVFIPFVISSAMEGKKKFVDFLKRRNQPCGWVLKAVFSLMLVSQILIFYIHPISARNDLIFPVALKPPSSFSHLKDVSAWIDWKVPLVVSNALGSHVAKRSELMLFGAERDAIGREEYSLLVDLNATDPWPFHDRKAYLKKIREWMAYGNRSIAYDEEGLLLLVPGEPQSEGQDKLLKHINDLIDQEVVL